MKGEARAFFHGRTASGSCQGRHALGGWAASWIKIDG